MKYFPNFLKVFVLLFGLIMAVSCIKQPVEIDKNKAMEKHYYKQIEDWREKVRREGWSNTVVDEIINTSIANCTYDWQPRNLFKSPQQMIRGGFEGNCADIGSLVYGTLKRLKYPHEVRLQVVRILWAHHMLVKIQMPSGKWQIYQTVNNIFARMDEIFYTPVIEFNEESIWEYT